MTVVGSVEYLVEGVIDPAHFDKSIDTPLNRAAARAGDRFGTVLGRAIAVAVRPFAARAGDDIGDELSRRGRGHGLSFGRLVGAGITAGLGVASIGAAVDVVTRGIGDSVRAAGELDTAVGRSGRTFGAASAGVQAFAADARRNLLLSKQDALSAADAFGLLFRGGGVDQSKAAELSVRLTGIAQNLSALHHVPVADVLNALREGVQGNVEPLRDLGINLDAARVKSEAYAEGLARPVRDAPAIARAQTVVAAAAANLATVQTEHGKGTLAAAEAQDKLSKAQEALAKATAGATPALSANEATLARTGLILRDAQGSTGAAASSMGDYSVATQHLRAQLGTLSAELGTKLLPYVVDGERKFSALIDQFQAGVGTGGEIRDVLGELGDVAHTVGDVLGSTVVPAVKFFADHPDALKGVAASMVVYAAATKTAAFYSALIKPPVPIPAAGPAALVAGATGTFYGLGKYAHLNPRGFTGAATKGNPLLDAVFGKPSSKPPGDGKPIADFALGELGAIGVQKAKAAQKAADSLHATQVRMQADATKTAKATKYEADQQAAYQERQRAAVEAAEDAARARGEATTRALQAQSDKIRGQVDRLEDYAQKIKNFRSSVVGKAGDFTSLTSLVSDPSRATAAGIVGSLQSRVLAEKLFAKNLTALAGRHLDKGVLAELAQAGPEQRALVSALAGGSDAQIRALNAAERGARGAAAGLGDQATTLQFGAGAVQRTNAELARLNTQVATLNRQVAAQPGLIAKAVDQASKNAKVRQTTGTRTAVTR